MKYFLLKKQDIKYLIFLFFISSTICWFFEILYSLIIRSKLVLPGALYGPWCPVYGFAFIFLFLLIDKRKNKVVNFIKIFVLLTVLEYLASLVSEYFFDRIIWDYSEFFMNINGRVCLYMSLFFALAGYITIMIVEPLLHKIYIRYFRMNKIVSYLLSVLFIVDLLLSLNTK